jgi:hypothetical protein
MHVCTCIQHTYIYFLKGKLKVYLTRVIWNLSSHFFFFSIHTTFFFVNSGESASSSNDIRVSGLRFRDFESGPGEGLGSEGWG